MKIINSIWLVPEENDETYLRNLIDELSKEYNAPSFIPHLTLFPDINLPINEIREIIEDVFSKQQPFEIKSTGINQSDNFLKTVFQEFELNNELTRFYKNISAKTDHRDISEYKPHISFIYKTMPEEERIKITKNIELKNKYAVNRIFVCAPKQGDEDFYDISNWDIQLIKTL